MEFGAAVLRAVLEESVPAGAAGLVVALSGGADSACLLTALCAAKMGRHQEEPQLVLNHVWSTPT